jgi:hypothetical protein
MLKYLKENRSALIILAVICAVVFVPLAGQVASLTAVHGKMRDTDARLAAEINELANRQLLVLSALETLPHITPEDRQRITLARKELDQQKLRTDVKPGEMP